MSAVLGMTRAWRGFRGTSRTHLIEAGDRRGLSLARGGMLVSMRATLAAARSPLAVLARFHILGCLWRVSPPMNALPPLPFARPHPPAGSPRHPCEFRVASPPAPP